MTVVSLWTNCPYCGIRLTLGQACSCEEWKERERELKEKSGFQSLQENIDLRKYTPAEFLTLPPEEMRAFLYGGYEVEQHSCERCGNPDALTVTLGVTEEGFKLKGFLCDICKTEFFSKIWPEFLAND